MYSGWFLRVYQMLLHSWVVIKVAFGFVVKHRHGPPRQDPPWLREIFPRPSQVIINRNAWPCDLGLRVIPVREYVSWFREERSTYQQGWQVVVLSSTMYIVRQKECWIWHIVNVREYDFVHLGSWGVLLYRSHYQLSTVHASANSRVACLWGKNLLRLRLILSRIWASSSNAPPVLSPSRDVYISGGMGLWEGLDNHTTYLPPLPCPHLAIRSTSPCPDVPHCACGYLGGVTFAMLGRTVHGICEETAGALSQLSFHCCDSTSSGETRSCDI